MEDQAEEEGEQRVNGNTIVAGVGGTPSEDGYNWKNYGRTRIKSSEFPRRYFKCTHSNCPAKKKVVYSHEGHMTEIIYMVAHNHPKPPPSRWSGIGSANPHADMQVDNPEHVEATSAASAIADEYGNQSINLQTQNGITHLDSGDAVDGSSTFSNEEQDGQGTHGSVSLGYDAEGDESKSKRRKLESFAEMIGSTRAICEPRVVVQTTSKVDILDDGYRWQKYGDKVVKGNLYPRSYYRCTNAGCTVRKHVERASHDLKSVITSYNGKHNHDVPAARSSRHVNANNASNAGQGQASGLLQNHAHRTEPSQIHNGMGRPSLGSFNFHGRQQLAHPHSFSFGMNQHLFNLAMSGLGPSSLMHMNPFMAQQQHQQQQRVANEMGIMLPNGDLMNHMPFGPHM
ncbi:probable WRKY transcription factor 2 [Lathyrus oleraceus]|uniref:WRKY domain-containing protein n=1 Tax=Pisum sativum TaxID=3888 RepID=A0A9D4WYD3_PEA|nr:probable WRKY transcription factor 2 [Pisum sativum]KAI5411389.1 hypothetical protein KIW84_056467 [Pisum sativum]